MSRPALPIVLWVMVCAWLNVAGWLLSAFGWLNRAGYVLVLSLLATAVWRQVRRAPQIRFPRRRFRHALPRTWLLLAAMIFVGALIYPPNNFDSLTYRVPRVLHWLAADRWHWIPANYEALNTRATGFEFVIAPLLLFLHTDRWCVLINVAAYVLFPSLTFSVFVRFGIAPRAAWRWMWVVPAGYCYVLQCGGMANDAYGAVCALAMMYFALRARQTREWRDAALALVAAAITTGAKSGNLPLLLPLALALLPVLQVLLRKPLATTLALGCCALASIAPITLLNIRHAGTWFGSREEYTASTGGPWTAALTGNGLLLATTNLAPPIAPGSSSVNAAITKAIPAGLRTSLRRYFGFEEIEPLVRDIQTEERAGLGFGVCWLFIATCFAGAINKRRRGTVPVKSRDTLWISWSVWISLLFVILHNFMSVIPRLAAPYYALLLPAPLLTLETASVVCQRWWKRAALVAAALAALLLVVNPSRPLWPAITACHWLRTIKPESIALERIEMVYQTYRHRPEVLAELRDFLPANEHTVGVVDRADPEASLWRPFGQRWVKQVLPGDTAATLRARGIRTIVVSAPERIVFDQPLEQWLARVNGTITATRQIQIFAGQPAWDWHIVRLAEPSRPAASE